MKVLCVGEMMVDIIARPITQISLQNETCQVEEIRVISGGDANNNAMNFAKLGHSVTYLGRVGCDDMGEYVVSAAQKAGINMDYVVRSPSAAQPKSLILVNAQGDRTFLQTPGTSAEFCLEDCPLSLLEDADLLQIGGAFHLPKFDGAGSAALLRQAQERSVLTAMDITTDRTGQWRDVLAPCYPYLDYFLPSIEHAAKLAGTEHPDEIADYFLSRGVQAVAIKLGERGSFFKNAREAFYASCYQDISVVETTGAGDAFCAGFLTGAGRGLTPEACVTLGTACSAFAIQAVGATAGMPEMSVVEAFIQSRPPLHIQRIS